MATEGSQNGNTECPFCGEWHPATFTNCPVTGHPLADGPAPDFAAERFALLVSQLGDELGRKHGWKAEVSRRLGVHRSYVSRAESGDRTGIGLLVINRVVQRLGIDRRFFFDPTLRAPKYSEFVGATAPTTGPKSEDLSDPTSWNTILAEARAIAEQFSLFGAPADLQLRTAKLAERVLMRPEVRVARAMTEANTDTESELLLRILVKIAEAHAKTEQPVSFEFQAAVQAVTQPYERRRGGRESGR